LPSKKATATCGYQKIYVPWRREFNAKAEVRQGGGERSKRRRRIGGVWKGKDG